MLQGGAGMPRRCAIRRSQRGGKRSRRPGLCPEPSRPALRRDRCSARLGGPRAVDGTGAASPEAPERRRPAGASSGRRPRNRRRGLSSRRDRGFHGRAVEHTKRAPVGGTRSCTRASEANALLACTSRRARAWRWRTARSCWAFTTPLIGTACRSESAGVLGSGRWSGVFGRAVPTRCFSWIPRSRSMTSRRRRSATAPESPPPAAEPGGDNGEDPCCVARWSSSAASWPE